MTSPVAELAAALDVAPGSVSNEPARRNIQPGQEVIVYDGTLKRMRWGIIPVGRKNARGRPVMETIINARSETIARKPAFGAAARARRCPIPADGFYEWLREGKAKQPYWVHPSGPAETIVAFAGVWETWRGPGGETVDACAIVT